MCTSRGTHHGGVAPHGNDQSCVHGVADIAIHPSPHQTLNLSSGELGDHEGERKDLLLWPIYIAIYIIMLCIEMKEKKLIVKLLLHKVFLVFLREFVKAMQQI